MTFLQGLVFKWGSLVGISLPTTGANETPFRGAADVVFRPAGFTGAITDDWASVPYCATDFAPYDNTATDHLIAVHNPATGIGDICRYMGVIDSANWRMPTASEIAELYGSDQPNGGQSVVLGGGWVTGNYYPLSGLVMGPRRNGVKITGSGADARVTNADPNTDGAVFLPASGHRTTDGAIYRIGHSGFYWSSTALTLTDGYRMWFNSTTVWPQSVNARTLALSIRCIRE